MVKYRVVYFICGLCAHLITVVVQGYVARDMSCPDINLHSRPRSDENTVRIFLSIEDNYHIGVPPICKLVVTLPRLVNMYQAMLLAEYQHRGGFNFSARADDMVGFALQHINGKWGRNHLTAWVLHDGDSGQPISKSITEVFVEDRKQYTWVYSRYSAIGNPYHGACRTQTNSVVPRLPSVNHAMLYMSVQFWSETWPLCKLPVLFIDRSMMNLNDLMSEAKRQYKHLFIYQRYPDYHLYDINDLHDEGEYFWKAEVADSDRVLNEVLYLVSLEDGDHVVWRYMNENGDPRYKTVEPGQEYDVVTPQIKYEKPNNDGSSDTHIGNDRLNTGNTVHIRWTIFAVSLLATWIFL